MRKPTFLRLFRRSGGAGITLLVATVAVLLGAARGFVDPISLLITIGGALGVTALTFSRERIDTAWRQLRAALLADESPSRHLITELKRLARIHRVDGPIALERAVAEVDEPFLRAAIDLVL